MKFKSQKLKLLMVGALMFAVAWVGYWIGYTHSPGSDISDPDHALNINNQNFKISKYMDLKKRLPALKTIHNSGNSESKKEGQNFDFIDDDHADVSADEQDDKDTVGHFFDLDKHESVLQNGKDIVKQRGKAKNKLPEKDNLLENIRGKLAAHQAQQDEDWLQEQNDALKQQQQQSAKKLQVKALEKPVFQNSLNDVKEDFGQFERNKKADDTYYALLHSGMATRVHSKIHEKIKTMPDHISPDLYILQSNKLPQNKRFRPSIGNGHLATVVHTEKVFMNGLYNGYKTDSHRAVIPSTCAVNITGTIPPTQFTRTSSLNLAEGIYMEQSVSDDYILTQRLYAHRNMTRLLVVEVDLVRRSLKPLRLQTQFTRWTGSDDVTFLKDESDIKDVSYKHGRINSPETDQLNYTEVHLYYDHVPKELVPPSTSLRTKWVFMTAIAHNKTDAYNAYKEGTYMIRNHDNLYATHVEAWADLWARGSIHIDGNDELSQSVYSSFYYLMSSLPVNTDTLWPYVGLSPTGLPYGDLKMDYQGHVMWDQETWMYPNILLFHADIAQTILSTRKRTMKAAKELAQKRRSGDQSLEYPWESAFTGSDVTLDRECAEYEIHINGDISRAIMQYLYATDNVEFIHNKTEGYSNILAGIANFWVSKLIFNRKSSWYEIRGVMPPDEHAGIVNNSVYTNTIAQMSLTAMEEIFQRVQKSQTYWKNYADNVYIPFNSKLKYHPEYDGYYKGKSVKQADAILLGYPLNRNMAVDVRKNDLLFYEQVTAKTGPAMTWCMYSIGWLELGEKAKADALFQSYKQYIQGDFQIWTEQPDGKGAVNFLTGIGGFLQNIIAGYGGFRLYPTHLEFNPVLPPGTTSITFVDIDYLGSSLDFRVTEKDISVIVRRSGDQSPSLHLYIYHPEQVHTLQKGMFVTVKRNKGALLSAKLDLPIQGQHGDT